MREIRVTIKTEQKTESVTEKNGKLLVCTRAPASDGRANIEVIRLVSEFLEIPPKGIMIIRGHTTPSKTIRIYG